MNLMVIGYFQNSPWLAFTAATMRNTVNRMGITQSSNNPTIETQSTTVAMTIVMPKFRDSFTWWVTKGP